MDALDLNPLLSVPAAGLTASTVARLIGEQAIHLYQESLETAAAPITLPGESMG
jgi:hypothetical protein